MSNNLSTKTDQVAQSALNSMAKQVKAAREAKQLSQRELSARTGIPQSHISKIENGGADIRISSMLSIARALDLELTLIPRSLVVTLNALRNTAAHGQEGTALTQAPAYQLDEEEDDG